ncbi:Gluconokinase [Pseudomonas sp. 8Z]|uniref:gluconokinase n=1 Tax=Pseudomonas sp. 8Z TaxID=2653166 RepID=UPI0012F164C8|nr:gluconokinase [Pseudomonas sp. 8Z]VXD05139.1 Gluconokinase [Pseudomonas sp. 8Z]
MHPRINALVVMGVAGCGKSSVGQAIAKLTDAVFIEGDAFHPPANIAKMSAGIPLDDNDRAGWLVRLGEELRAATRGGQRAVLTCSALRHAYRRQLRQSLPGLGFVYLELARETAGERVASRPDHFMPASLIDSQFAALEPPHVEPLTLVLDATLPVDQLSQEAEAWWKSTDSIARPA